MFVRTLGIDVGEKRTGLAQSDPTGTFATTVGTFDEAGLFARIEDIRRSTEIRMVVVGWPISLKGEEGEATRRVEAFLARFGKRFPELPVVKWDERFTSVMAQQTILASGVGRKKRQDKARVDTVAAAHLLQSYLDHGSASHRPV